MAASVMADTVTITLSWTAPGDDDYDGTAAAYDLRYSTESITDANWYQAKAITGEPEPAVSGTVQNCAVSGLTSGIRYYFALKVTDESGNWSSLSNVVSRMSGDFICGDANSDGLINIADMAYIISSIFLNGGLIDPIEAGDANSDGVTNIVDAGYIQNFIFWNGPAPCEN